MTGNDFLQLAAQRFGQAAGGDKAVLSCADGLHALINAAGLGALDPNLCADVQRLLFAAAPCVAADPVVLGLLPAEHIFHGLGTASAVLTTTDKDRFWWLLAFARMLEAELRAFHLRALVVACNQLDLAHAVCRNPLAAVFHPEPMTAH